MAKAKKQAPTGAPEWMTTYGDMVTLLLTFFVMLVSIANFEVVDDKFNAAVQSIREALGNTGQSGKRVDPNVDFHSLLAKLESIVPPPKPLSRGDTKEKGIYGDSFRLRRIRDGMEITLGGPILFEPFSDKITLDGKDALEQIGNELMGHRHKIEIFGHAADQPRPADWTFQDAMLLSFNRAEEVAEALIERGVDPRTIRIVAVGPNEPIQPRAYDPSSRDDNRRVEIIIRESMIDDYVGQDPVESVPTTMPATGPAETTSPTTVKAAPTARTNPDAPPETPLPERATPSAGTGEAP